MAGIQELIYERLLKGDKPDSIFNDITKQMATGALQAKPISVPRTYSEQTLAEGKVHLDIVLSELEQILRIFSRNIEADALSKITDEQKTALLNQIDTIVDNAVSVLPKDMR